MIAASEPRTPLRWAAVFSLVALAHGALLALLGPVAKPADPVSERAMLIDLAPQPTIDPTLPEPKTLPMQRPGPEPPEAALAQPTAPELQPPPTAPPVTAMPEPMAAEPAPPDAVPPATAMPEPMAAEPVSPEPPILDPLIPDPAPAPLPQVTKPPAVPRRVPSAVRPKPASSAPVSRPAEPGPWTPTVTAPPASASAAASVPMSWQTRLLAHLNRYKRYPPDAQMHGRQGVAVVHLRLLPDGSAAFVRLDSSSGTDALDREAIGLIGRAQPLPVPGGETGSIDIAVPIEFKVR